VTEINGSASGAELYDEEVDVIVVGYGYAGAISALEAARAGARVLVLEKAAVPGGISICSYGSVRSARDAGDALSYLSATNAGRSRDDLLQALASGMTEMEDYVRELAAETGSEIATTKNDPKAGANYPLPGYTTFYHTTIASIPDFAPREVYPAANGAEGGVKLFRVLEGAIAPFVPDQIEIRFGASARRLITEDAGVTGLVADFADGPRHIRARRGVVLACGGFEGNHQMQDHFWEPTPVLPAAARNNTGDGIVMAQDLGAAIWHMWHFHGVYGFRHTDPDYPYGIRVKRLPDWMPGKADRANVSMAWILLDRQGRRFMNEYQPYLQDTSHRSLHLFDPHTQDFARIPSFLIFDENGRKLYPMGKPTSNDPDVFYDWSEDNMAEVENGILSCADTLAELASKIGVDAGAVEASVTRWNALCASGGDDDFGRPAGTMVPIAEPPFYGAAVWPVLSNTQGGPIRDAEGHVLDVYGDPIRNLYTAGELGSAFGHLYMSGGNIAECFISGRIAGRNAARGSN